MITQDTVFILGAGASAPYGYPTAKELRTFIITQFRNKYSSYIQKSRNTGIIDARSEADKFSYLIESFNQSATNWMNLFLSRNKESFYEQGKFILAWCILYFESISSFNESIKKSETDWYKWFYNEITKEIIRSNDLEKLEITN